MTFEPSRCSTQFAALRSGAASRIRARKRAPRRARGWRAEKSRRAPGARALVRSVGDRRGSVSGGATFSKSETRRKAAKEKSAEENARSRRPPASLPERTPAAAARTGAAAAPQAQARRSPRPRRRRQTRVSAQSTRAASAETGRGLRARARAEALASPEGGRQARARARAARRRRRAAQSGGGRSAAASTRRRVQRLADSPETWTRPPSPPPTSSPRSRPGARVRTSDRGGARAVRAGDHAARHARRGTMAGSAHAASALAEFTGVVPSPAAAGEMHVGFRDFSGESSHNFPPDASTHDGELGRERDANSTSKSNSVARVIVTPGESGFAAALRGVGESGARTKLDGDALFFVRSSEDSSGASDASSRRSDEYGSVLSFATGVSHASHGSAGIARGSSDDLDLLVAEAAEVVNRHDFVISRKAEREDDEDSLDEDDAETRLPLSSGTANASNSESDEEEDEEGAYGRAKRERLPAPQPLNQSFSIWDRCARTWAKICRASPCRRTSTSRCRCCSARWRISSTSTCCTRRSTADHATAIATPRRPSTKKTKKKTKNGKHEPRRVAGDVRGVFLRVLVRSRAETFRQHFGRDVRLDIAGQARPRGVRVRGVRPARRGVPRVRHDAPRNSLFGARRGHGHQQVLRPLRAGEREGRFAPRAAAHA